MLFPSAPLSDIDTDLLLHDTHNKINAGHLYLRQPHTVQIIQLVEGPPPPPRRIGSAIDSGSASSASSCDYSSEYSESADEDAMEEEDDDEVCSSYCSSDLPPEELDTPHSSFEESRGDNADTYSVRMKRILAWRENFCAHLGATLSESALPLSLKRKISSDEDEDDNMSHSSKRSRSQASQGDEGSVISIGALSCPACDAFFATSQSLRQHGRDAQASNEACCVAVEYAFE